MPRWSLVVLLVAGAVCAGFGTALTLDATLFGAAGFGWTAYSPLSRTVYSAGYSPVDLTWLFWEPRLGAALIALGAGTAGGALVGLLVRRPANHG